MDWQILVQYGPLLLRGFGVTILTWVIGSLCGMVLGLAITLAQRHGPVWLRLLLQAYIEIVRGTPFLVQLYVLYFGGPSMGLRLDAVPAGLIGLAIYSSAYFAEIFRSGFRAVPVGQIEAARAIGMSEPAILYRILLPLGLVSALPALVNFSIILTKETVILSMITVPELLHQVTRMSADTFTHREAILALAFFFWLLVEAISRSGRRLERKITHYLIERP